MTKNKSYANIDGILHEYDVCTGLKQAPFLFDEDIYERLGQGYIETVCGIVNHDRSEKIFYLIKKVKKKNVR